MKGFLKYDSVNVMPVQPFKEPNSGGKYYCITNSGPDDSQIFADKGDRDTFLGCLQGYLKAEDNLERYKKTFTVKGKSYQGVPHLNKNYHGKLELISYALSNNSYKLVMKEITDNTMENFLKSLGTKYSIYYNKKYSHQGKVFENSAKTERIGNPEWKAKDVLNKELLSTYSFGRVVAATAIFVVLFLAGINNIQTASNQKNPTVLGVSK